MRKLLWFGLALMVFASGICRPSMAQDSSDRHTITLYAPLYPGDLGRVSVDLQRAAYASRLRFGDVGYGLLHTGQEWDWLHVSNAGDSRTVILDLGLHAWTDSFTVPWVEPLAKLKPGEVRQVFVSTSGKDGKGSSGGYEGLSALPSTDGPGDGSTYVPNPRPRQPKNDTGVRTSQDMLRAILGHMYVIHVVDDTRDFYALVRVESLQRGYQCSISWKLITSPNRPPVKK